MGYGEGGRKLRENGNIVNEAQMAALYSKRAWWPQLILSVPLVHKHSYKTVNFHDDAPQNQFFLFSNKRFGWKRMGTTMKAASSCFGLKGIYKKGKMEWRDISPNYAGQN